MGVYNIEMGDRRKHDRQEKAIEFFCYINGQRFDSTTFDISKGGVFLRTDYELAVGTSAIVAPKGERERVSTSGNAPAVDVGAILVGLVVRKQDEPVHGVGIEWVRCVSRNGIQAVFDLLAFYLGLFPASLPMPMPSIAAAETVAYDFKRRQFFIPKILSSAARAKERGSARSALAQAAKSVVEQMKQGPLKKAEVQPTLTSLLRPQTTPPPPVEEDEPTRPYVDLEMESVLVDESEDGLPTVPDMPAVRIPAVSPPEIMDPPDCVQDQWTGPVKSVIDRKDSWIPVNVGVEFFAGGEVRQGTVRFIGVDGLYLMSNRVPGDIEGKVIITYPVPVEGAVKAIYLVCDLGRVDRIAEGGLSGIELEIRSVRKEPAPGLFKRYVKYLYIRMLSEE